MKKTIQKFLRTTMLLKKVQSEFDKFSHADNEQDKKYSPMKTKITLLQTKSVKRKMKFLEKMI